MEPTAQDINNVAQLIDNGNPAPQAPVPQAQPAFTPGIQSAPSAPTAPTPAPTQPAQQQPTQPVSQPAPSAQPQDPFSMMFQSPEPTQPTQPTEPQNPQPTQPTEPTQPTPQVNPQPNTQPAPTTPAPQQEYETFDQYMERVTQGVGQNPEMPDASKIDPNDEAGIKNFFDELVNTAVTKATNQAAQTAAIQNTERQLWDQAFDKYGTLKSNKELRDMVHSIRMGEFNKGIAITPTQAADRLITALSGQYSKGVADNQVVTTIQDVQPNGGGSQPIQTSTDMDNVLLGVQNGGEVALAAYLDTQVKAGII